MPAFVWRAIRRWSWAAVGALIGALLGLGLATISDRVYRVHVLLAPAETFGDIDRLSALADQIGGGLGGLGGLVGGLGGAKRSTSGVAIETMKGVAFTNQLVTDLGLAPSLFPDLWDAGAKRWKGRVPTPMEIHRVFEASVRSIWEDKKTGFIHLQIEWREPKIAFDIAAASVERVNAQMRAQAIAEAERSIASLKHELDGADSLELKQAVNRLIEAQLRQVTVARARADYSLRIIDPPLVPQERDFVWPRRMLMIAVGLVLGGALAVLLALIVPNRRDARPGAASA